MPGHRPVVNNTLSLKTNPVLVVVGLDHLFSYMFICVTFIEINSYRRMRE